MKRLVHLFACLLALMTLFVRPAAAQDAMPETIAYQGYLTNTDGDPANGAATVVFRLYDRSSGGTALWQETQQDVLFTDGVFTVHLGEVESLAEVPFGGPLWLGVSVAGSQELTPRVALEAVPYALSVRGLRIEPVVDPQQGFTLNMIGGHPANEASDGAFGATISGGGVENFPNRVEDNFGTVGGGGGNTATGAIATVGGGSGNEAEGEFSTVGGGTSNTANGRAATIGGGTGNEVGGERSTIGGGANNTATGDRATIAGGENNTADRYATVGGGQVNNAGGFSATIGGGTSNVASGEYATVAGGQGNEATGNNATIGGGRDNRATGLLAMVPGGFQTYAEGFVSFAAGYNARALHDGAFVWTDTEGIPVPFSSTGEDQFLIRAAGGVGIGTNAPKGALHLTETDLGIDPGDVNEDALIIEGNAPVITLYGNFQQNTRPGLVLAGVENGSVGDKWGIVREYFGFNGLHFTYGLNQDHTQNDAVMKLSSQTGAESRAFTATNDLGANGTPSAGGHYRDNVVYAWAHVNADGSVASSYGCTVSKLTGTGSYRITFKRQLPNGASATVTPQTLNDPVIATAFTNASRADVATKVFNGTAFVAFDSAFYVQVVGRP